MKFSIQKTQAYFIFSSLILLAAMTVFFCLAPPKVNPSLRNDINTGFYLVFSRNLLHYPISVTKLGMTQVVDDPPAPLFSDMPDVTFYPDHPPGVTWAMAAVQSVFGSENLVASRMLSAFGSVLALGCLLWAAAPAGGLAGALGAMIVFCFPVFWVHGLVLNLEPMAYGFMALAAACFFNFLQTNTRRALGFFFGAYFLALIADWPAFFMLAPFAGALALEKRFRDLAWVMGFTFGVFFLIQFHLAYVVGDWAYPFRFISIALKPFYSSAELSARSSWNAVLLFSRRSAEENYGKSPLILAGFGLLALFFQLFREPKLFVRSRIHFFALSFAFPGILNIICFPLWAQVHSFWTYYCWLSIVSIPLAVASRFPKKWSIAALVVFAIYLSPDIGLGRDTLREVAGYKMDSYDEIAVVATRLNDPTALLVAYDPNVFYGIGYLVRDHVNRQLHSHDWLTGSSGCEDRSIYLVLNKELSDPSLQPVLLSARIQVKIYQIQLYGVPHRCQDYAQKMDELRTRAL